MGAESDRARECERERERGSQTVPQYQDNRHTAGPNAHTRQKHLTLLTQLMAGREKLEEGMAVSQPQWTVQGQREEGRCIRLNNLGVNSSRQARGLLAIPFMTATNRNNRVFKSPVLTIKHISVINHAWQGEARP